MNPSEKVKELVEAIKNSEQVQEYMKIKNEVYQDDNCKEMIKEFRDKQSEVQSLLMEGKEEYRGVQFIDLEELEFNINRFLELSEQ